MEMLVLIFNFQASQHPTPQKYNVTIQPGYGYMYPHIVAKKADKGSAVYVVIMNSCDYIQEMNHQLSNKENYLKLMEDAHNPF